MKKGGNRIGEIKLGALFVFLILTIFLFSCATTPSPQASRIREASSAQVQRCEFLGNVKGSSGLSGIFREAGYENALNELYDNAAKLGATHVVVQHKDANYWASGQYLRGEAFKCR